MIHTQQLLTNKILQLKASQHVHRISKNGTKKEPEEQLRKTLNPQVKHAQLH